MEVVQQHEWGKLGFFQFIKACKHCKCRKIQALKGHYRTRYREYHKEKTVTKMPPCITRKLTENGDSA